MSSHLINAVEKMRSSFKSTGGTYHAIPQNLSQGDLSSQVGINTEKRAQHVDARPRWYWSLLPWFLTAALGKTTRTLPRKTSTSYLNGIRGIACLIVYTEHVSMHYYRDFMSNPYGAEPAANNHGFSQLPIIRIIYAGKGMVAIFFVLSGFVLTYSPLKKITSISERHQDQEDVVEVRLTYQLHMLSWL